MYAVETRYERWTSTGKEFTKWFKLTLATFELESEANEFIKQYKKDSVNPKMHLKEEFRIVQE